jgi:hypothetical protein
MRSALLAALAAVFIAGLAASPAAAQAPPGWATAVTRGATSGWRRRP